MLAACATDAICAEAAARCAAAISCAWAPIACAARTLSGAVSTMFFMSFICLKSPIRSPLLGSNWVSRFICLPRIAAGDHIDEVAVPTRLH